MEVYRHDIQKGQEEFYGELLYAYDQYKTVQDHLSAIAQMLHAGLQQKQKFLFYQLNNYNKDFIAKSVEVLLEQSFTLLDAQNTIAQEYGFKNWHHLTSLTDLAYQVPFQKAINLLLEGKESELKEILQNHPDIVSLKSNYGHKASLLHYVGSNGVEMWRQKVPSNLVKLTQLLLDHRADPDALMNVYGGEFKTYDLLITSAHPIQAGILDDMKSLFT